MTTPKKIFFNKQDILLIIYLLYIYLFFSPIYFICFFVQLLFVIIKNKKCRLVNITHAQCACVMFTSNFAMYNQLQSGHFEIGIIIANNTSIGIIIANNTSY